MLWTLHPDSIYPWMHSRILTHTLLAFSPHPIFSPTKRLAWTTLSVTVHLDLVTSDRLHLIGPRHNRRFQYLSFTPGYEDRHDHLERPAKQGDVGQDIVRHAMGRLVGFRTPLVKRVRHILGGVVQAPAC